jgi:TonB-dependent receptor
MRAPSVGAWAFVLACSISLRTAPAAAQATTESTNPPTPAASKSPDAIEEVVVTGYRKALLDATEAKRAATGISDSIFAEDIGKFPDSNIAESFNRIPGIQITRDADDSGVNIAIRGLGTNFTRVLLNGAPVAVASTGILDVQNSNREVDLNMFPTELFTKLTVQKTTSASMLEGGAAGTVDMRSARPFDNPGAHLTYAIQETNNEHAGTWGQHGSILASDTMGPFGVLVGFVGVHNPSRITGFETIGWTNPKLSVPSATISTTQAQCLASACNVTGGGNWTIPATVPEPAGVTGPPINQAFLLAANPGATIQQINGGLLPRLGRPMDDVGTRDRDNGVLALEYRPNDSVHLYVDSLYGRERNDLQRYDMDWVVRNGAAIPFNETFDRSDCSQGCVVTSGTFTNSQFFLEYRPYKESTDFWSVNPGLDWQIGDDWKADVRANKTHSIFHRESPSVLAATAPDVTVDYTNNGGIPRIVSDVNLNDPNNFMWNGSARVNIQDERRSTDTKGVRGDLTFGHGGPLNISVGAAYDDVSRRINALDNSQLWQNAVCGGGPSPSLPSPNKEPGCTGWAPSLGIPLPSNYPTYPYLGHGVSAGITTPLVYNGSLIPQNVFPSYLRPSRDGFITVNWPAFAAASQYALFHGAEPVAASANTGAVGGKIEEKSTGIYGQLSGTADWTGNRLRYTLGLRYVRTEQSIGGNISVVNPNNATLEAAAGSAAGCLPAASNFTSCEAAAADGSLFPNAVQVVTYEHTYYNRLPAGELAYNISDNAVAKLAASKTMTRPNPSALLPGASFINPSADVGTLGNTSLQPFISENLDLGLEYYEGGSSYWSVNTFRKRITGFTTNNNISEPFSFLAQYGITYATLSPTQQIALTARGYPGVDPTVVLTQQVNASGAVTINGLEVNWVQSFDPFIGRFGLDGFGFNFNFTLIDQFGQGAAPAVALGVAPHSYNLSLYYEHGPVSARISTVYNAGSQVSTANQNGIPAAAIFVDDFQQYDFSSSLDLSKIFGWSRPLQLTFDVVNLSQARPRTYFQFSNATFAEFDPGRSMFVGVRGQL